MLCRKNDAPFIIKKLDLMIKSNKNLICAWVGQTGSGKSWSAIGLAERYSAYVGVDFTTANIVFSPGQMMKLINAQLPSGSVIVLDEAGVAINARSWMTKINKLLGYLMQTFRHRNYILFMCVPDLSFIDKTARSLLHCFCETKNINRQNQTCKVVWKWVDVNPQTGKIYYKYLRVKQPNQPQHILKSMNIGKPSELLIKSYEEKKHKYTTELNKTIEDGVKDVEEVNVKNEVFVTEKQFIVMKLRNKHHLRGSDISRLLLITQANVSATLKRIPELGYSIITKSTLLKSANGKIDYVKAMNEYSQEWSKKFGKAPSFLLKEV